MRCAVRDPASSLCPTARERSLLRLRLRVAQLALSSEQLVHLYERPECTAINATKPTGSDLSDLL